MSQDERREGAAPRSPVGRKAGQIAHPYRDRAKDTASRAEAHLCRPSGAAVTVGARREPQRKWYSLYDKVFAVKNLQAAWERVQANGGAAGCDGQTVAQFAVNAEANLLALHEQLRTKQYRPRPVKRVWIPKAGGGRRPLGIPTVRDRIVQQAVLQVLSPIFEPLFSKASHGFRPERGCGTALDIVDRALSHGYQWVVDADIEQFFDSVDHGLLIRLLNEEIADGSVLNLIAAFLQSGVLIGGSELAATEVGTPQGGPLSPLLANVYLHPLDEALTEGQFGLVRYADDLVVFTKTRQRAEEALQVVQTTLQSLQLRLHPTKSRVATVDEGFDFLGYHYFRDGAGRLQKVVSRKSEGKFREAIRQRTKRHAGQKHPKPSRCTAVRLRRNPRVQALVQRVNRYLRGWYGYFHGVRTSWPDYLNDFDRYVRLRLRSAILGRYAKGWWNQLLGNALLDQIGLLRLTALPAAGPAGPLAAPPSSG